MRLTENQHAAIVAEVSSLLGPDTKLWLFGSRADDRARGGDIDLYAEVPREVAIDTKVQLLVRLEKRLDNHVDLVIRQPGSPESPLCKIARMTGIRLDAVIEQDATRGARP